MPIDVFCHIMPQKYKAALYRHSAKDFYLKDSIDATPTLYDLDQRFRIMDKYEGLSQVLSLASPAVEEVAGAKKAVELSQLANDEMAELVRKYPDRFVAAVACLPMNDIEAALRETDRAIRDLKLRGVQIHTPVNDKPLDLPEFFPLYEKMADYDLPIWIHPLRTINYPDYRTEDKSLHRIFCVFGWPIETTTAMTRLVFAGVLERYPHLKFITHHCGGMVPYFEQRIVGHHDLMEVRGQQRQLPKPPIEYFKMFFNDTAVYGSTPALMCGYAFFGPDHLLFGTDMPYDSELGDRYTRETIKAIERMDIPDADKKKIFVENAKLLLHLAA